ncbi:Poly(A)-specific ribonuclease protein, partial [Dioscorea alata]
VCTSVYGPTDRQGKAGFWNEIRGICPGTDLPWVICGDFNSIFDPTDKLSGNYNREDLRLAQNLLRDLNLWEPPSFGRRFTWTNGQLNPIWVTLDRFLVNPRWTSWFPRVFQNYLPRFGSDHVPIRLESGVHNPISRTFRFEQAWCLVDNFDDLIKNWW